MKKKTKPPRKAKAKPSRAIVVRKPRPPATPSPADEAMRLICETHAMARETVERERARDEADNANKNAINEIRKNVIDLDDTLSATEVAFIYHMTEQNAYRYNGDVGFEFLTAKYFSNAKCRERWPGKYDESRFLETVREPRNRDRFPGVRAMLAQPQPDQDALPMLPETNIG
jgi:hypothetical protein